MRRSIVVVLALVAVLTAGTVASGAIPGPDGTVGTCFLPNEAARFVDDSSQCRAGETFLKLNQQGPKGDTGPAGPAGPAGAPGASAGSSNSGYPVAAATAFLDVEGIAGESVDAKHPGSIDVLAFDHGIVNHTTGGSGGGGTGKATLRDVTFTHAIDKASPALFLACATGKHIKKATLFVRKAGGNGFEYLKVTLSDVLVSSVRTHTQAPSTGAGPIEDVSLTPAKVEVSYTQQKPDGSAGPTTKASWHVKTNSGA